MLVLSRRNRESVVIGAADGFRGGSVRLGFEVDQSVSVHRSEVWERICVSDQQHTLTQGPAAAVV